MNSLVGVLVLLLAATPAPGPAPKAAPAKAAPKQPPAPTPAGDDEAEPADPGEDTGQALNLPIPSDLDLVSITSTTGQVQTTDYEKTLELNATVRNTLKATVSDLFFRAAIGPAGETEIEDDDRNVVDLRTARAIEPVGSTTVTLSQRLAFGLPKIEHFDLQLESYRVEKPSAELLLQMAEGGIPDMAAAWLALGLDSSAPDAAALKKQAQGRTDLLEALEKEAKAPADPATHTQVRRVFAIRALAALKGEEASGALVGALANDDSLLPMIFGFAMRQVARFGEPPAFELDLVRFQTLSGLVTAALKESVGEGRAASLLMEAAYGPRAELHAGARAALKAGWREPDELVAALGDDTAAFGQLARSEDAESVPLIVAAAAKGKDDGKAGQWLAAMPESAALQGIRLALGDSTGPVAPVLIKAVEQRGERAVADLSAALQEQGAAAPEKALPSALAQAVADVLRFGREQRFKDALAQVDKVLAESPPANSQETEKRPNARTAVDQAASLARSPQEKALAAQRYAQYASFELTSAPHPERFSIFICGVVERIEGLLHGRPATSDADAAIAALAQRLVILPRGAAWVARLASQLHDQKTRAAVAQSCAERAKGLRGSLADEWAQQSLKIDPANSTARGLLDSRRLEERMPVFVVVGALVLVTALLVLIARSGRKGFREGHCQVCGLPRPVNQVSFHYNIGMLLARRHASISGWMCKGCIHTQFWKFFLTNITLGWWGMISFFATPIFASIDLYHYVHSWFLPASATTQAAFARQPTDQELHQRIADLLAAGFTHDQIAERLENDFRIPRASTLAYLARLDAKLKETGSAT
jgi:hypothetical protein